MAGRGPQERLELLGGPCLLLDLGDGAEPWRVGDEGDVAGDEPSAGGVRESAADDEVDLVDGLGSETGAAVGRMEEVLVEAFEMVGSQPAQPDGAEGRQHMVLDLAAVAVVGAGGKDDPLARQPAGGQVRAKAQ